MSYKHGVFITEQPTALLPPVTVSTGLPFVLGTAPGPAGDLPVNEPRLVYSYKEFVEIFGFDEDFSAYTLCEFAKVYFGLYNVCPMVVVNVHDPAVQKTAVTAEAKTFANDAVTLAHKNVSGVVVKNEAGSTTYALNTDYKLDAAAGKITRVASGTIGEDAAVKVDYSYGDPSKVTGSDIIGGIDAGTGKKTGLELIGEVFPRFRLVVGSVVAPGFSDDATVAVTMGAKASLINGMFKAQAIVDVPESVKKYSDVPAYKESNNLTDEHVMVCWPRLKYGDGKHWMSSHLAGLLSNTDGRYDSVPYKSPSNERFEVIGAEVGDDEVFLSPQEAAYLNGNGIVTTLNWIGGWKCWGNRTGCYPGVTDPKDAFIPIRRTFNWISNTLILSSWQHIDMPVRKRLIDTVVDSFNIWLNGLAAREIILGGRVAFLETENPTTDVMDGIVRFHLWATPPSPGREFDWVVEYDPKYIKGLF